MSVESLKSMVNSQERVKEVKPPVENVPKQLNDKLEQVDKANDMKARQYDDVLQILSSVQPEKQINTTAQEQISKGYLDVKV